MSPSARQCNHPFVKIKTQGYSEPSFGYVTQQLVWCYCCITAPTASPHVRSYSSTLRVIISAKASGVILQRCCAAKLWLNMHEWKLRQQVECTENALAHFSTSRLLVAQFSFPDVSFLTDCISRSTMDCTLSTVCIQGYFRASIYYWCIVNSHRPVFHTV